MPIFDPDKFPGCCPSNKCGPFYYSYGLLDSESCIKSHGNLIAPVLFFPFYLNCRNL
jgi:hypothetical protein